MNFIAKEGELARKPTDDITKDDAADIQKLEVRQPARILGDVDTDNKLGKSARRCPARKGIRVVARTIPSRPSFATKCLNSAIEGAEWIKEQHPRLPPNSELGSTQTADSHRSHCCKNIGRATICVTTRMIEYE